MGNSLDQYRRVVCMHCVYLVLRERQKLSNSKVFLLLKVNRRRNYRKRPTSQTCGVSVSIIICAKAEHFFRRLCSDFFDRSFTSLLPITFSQTFYQTNKLSKQNERVFIICERSIHDNILS